MYVSYRIYELPWTLSRGDDSRFHRVLKHVVGVVLALGLVAPFLPVPEKTAFEVADVPPRLAQLVLERRAQPPPPPPPERVVEPEPEPVVQPKVEPKVQARPEPQVVPPPELPIQPPPEVRVEAARERAQASGILALSAQLDELRSNDAAAQVSEQRRLAANVDAAQRNERALITSTSGRRSSGIDSAALSRDTGTTVVAGRNLTTVHKAAAANAPLAKNPAGAAQPGTRSRADIERVFDRNKSAIYALYNRALRKDPSLEGKLVLSLTIAPSGKVTACSVVSSELNDPALERKLVQRVKLFDFGAADVSEVTTTKPIEFFPA